MKRSAEADSVGQKIALLEKSRNETVRDLLFAAGQPDALFDSHYDALKEALVARSSGDFEKAKEAGQAMLETALGVYSEAFKSWQDSSLPSNTLLDEPKKLVAHVSGIVGIANYTGTDKPLEDIAKTIETVIENRTIIDEAAVMGSKILAGEKLEITTLEYGKHTDRYYAYHSGTAVDSQIILAPSPGERGVPKGLAAENRVAVYPTAIKSFAESKFINLNEELVSAAQVEREKQQAVTTAAPKVAVFR